eukprot:1152832-Pelagomonas_calceolata.AAC.2
MIPTQLPTSTTVKLPWTGKVERALRQPSYCQECISRSCCRFLHPSPTTVKPLGLARSCIHSDSLHAAGNVFQGVVKGSHVCHPPQAPLDWQGHACAQTAFMLSRMTSKELLQAPTPSTHHKCHQNGGSGMHSDSLHTVRDVFQGVAASNRGGLLVPLDTAGTRAGHDRAG